MIGLLKIPLWICQSGWKEIQNAFPVIRWGPVGDPEQGYLPCVEDVAREFTQDDGDGYENVTKKWICAASNFIALIPSRLIRQMMANFCWSWILKDSIKVPEEKKKVVVFCSRPRQNVKLGSFTL